MRFSGDAFATHSVTDGAADHGSFMADRGQAVESSAWSEDCPIRARLPWHDQGRATGLLNHCMPTRIAGFRPCPAILQGLAVNGIHVPTERDASQAPGSKTPR